MISLSLEAIKQVTQTEQDCAQRKLDAVQAAKRTVAEAEKAGQAALDARRGEAQAQIRALMADAEAKAGVEADAVRADTAKACAALKVSAEQKLEQAAELIVRRVVNLK